MPDLLSFDDALARILKAAQPLDTEMRSLAAAAGYCLAESLTARLTQPPFNASAMDGYAVSAGAVEIGAPVPVIGRSEAGNGFTGTCPPGAAARIFTGAPVPEGLDAVVMQEEVLASGDMIVLAARPKSGDNIRLKGNDFSESAPLLGRGMRLTPAALSLCAAAGHGDVPVVRKPRIAIAMTGDELVPPGKRPGPHQIVASNGAGLMALLSPHASKTDDLGIVPDDRERLRETLHAALTSDADVIVTTGGASVGDKDFVHAILGELGAPPDLWRIAMRPGKPLMFAHHEGKLIFGLPGNPISALTTAILLLVPALRALAGDADPGPHFVPLPLATDLGHNGPRRHFRRARIVKNDNTLSVLPLEETDSAHLSSFAGADALVVHPEDSPALPAGTSIKTLFLVS